MVTTCFTEGLFTNGPYGNLTESSVSMQKIYWIRNMLLSPSPIRMEIAISRVQEENFLEE